MNTPVLFLMFNRPDTAQKVFDAIRTAQPRRLFVAADGPRRKRPDDIPKCTASREIIRQVDWNCEVKTLFRSENLDCGRAVNSAIIWFFEQVKQGIILEDDCLPHPSFFTFCETLLDRYKNDRRVWCIGGTQFYGNTSDASYYFSAMPLVWGWATWRDRWALYVFDASDIPVKKIKSALKNYFPDGNVRRYWLWRFYQMKEYQIATWDYQFIFSLWLNNALAVTPYTNLVSNVGFGEDATHTAEYTWKFNLPAYGVGTLAHPAEIRRNMDADNRFINEERHMLKRHTLIFRHIYLQCKIFAQKRFGLALPPNPRTALKVRLCRHAKTSAPFSAGTPPKSPKTSVPRW
jgi:hypothetical protein